MFNSLCHAVVVSVRTLGAASVIVTVLELVGGAPGGGEDTARRRLMYCMRYISADSSAAGVHLIASMLLAAR